MEMAPTAVKATILYLAPLPLLGAVTAQESLWAAPVVMAAVGLTVLEVLVILQALPHLKEIMAEPLLPMAVPAAAEHLRLEPMELQ